MNMQNCVLRNGRSGDWCHMADSNGRCHGLVPSSSEEIAQTTRCRQKHSRQWPRSIKIPQILRSPSKFSSTRSEWCSMAYGNGSCHGLAFIFRIDPLNDTLQMSKTSPVTTRQPKGRSKFRKNRTYHWNLRLQYHDWSSAADSSFRRSLILHIANVKHIAGDEQVTLTVAKTFEVYIYEIT